MDKKISLLLFMFMVSIIVPLFGGYTLSLFEIKFISVPLHSLLETAGAIMAFTLATIVLIMGAKDRYFTHFHYSSLALISMGIFDIFHAAMDIGELFVWLHSLAVFFGGVIFMTVWLKERVVSKNIYYNTPTIIAILSITISIFSISSPDILPSMIIDKKFSDTAIYLNIIGGIAFIVAGVNFLIRYWQNGHIDDLLFTGHTFLFGVSGLLFASSELWDLSWWLWHIMRFLAYFIALYYSYLIFIRNMQKLELSQIDLTQTNKQLSSALSISKEYQKALEVGSIVSKSDKRGKITYVNKNLCKLSGYSEFELLGNHHKILRHPNTSKDTYANMWKTIQSKNMWKGLIKNIKKNGSSFYTNITIVPLLDNNGDIDEYLAFREDITELIKSKEELRNSFYTDTLTSIGNRFKFLDDIKNYDIPSIALINIDGFSEINDFYGQDIGDKLLIEFTNYLFDHTISKGCSLYRLHGDEFMVLRETLTQDNQDEFIDDMRSVTKKINLHTFEIDEFNIDIKVTTAIVNNYKDKILLNADIAYKVAKKNKRSLIVFDKSIHNDEEYKNNIIWSGKIKKTIKHDKVIPYFQPIYDIKNKTIKKYETLMRLIDEDGKVVSPFFFLDISKKSKQYFELTKIIITKAFEVSKQNPDYEFSVNLSAEDIMHKELRRFIKDKLLELPTKNKIIFEIVESEGIENFEEMEYFIDWVKDKGAKIAIDDFGTGYSNFSYLIKLNADFIKIDGSLIKDIADNPTHKSVVETMVSFAKKNNMMIIAEYVENKKILDIIEDLGIDYAQGYYLGKPENKYHQQIKLL
jgi:PAS domain S-box-containing protein/diguanylate cyclase (GGDEF)-like protein